MMHPQIHLRAARKMLVLLLFLVSCGARGDISIYDYTVINSYPHNTRYFTQGLFMHDGFLYEGTGQYGESALRKLNLDDGEVLQQKALGRRYFGEGITVAGDRIYQLTWRENMVFVHDLETFDTLDSHYLATEGWGLAWNGEHLIISDGSDRLFFYDPDGFQEVRSVAVTFQGRPVRYLNELEYIRGEVWANIWTSNEIVRIDPQSGEVQSVIDLSGLRELADAQSSDAVLNGIAWDAERERLLVTGKLWAKIFEIELHERP
ncbi:glutaminyl-peptide cyclotransferase [Pseudohongiella acticola]|nr:glutaminyl-peptide cyclotransferase [Pseudohongiella acticola]